MTENLFQKIEEKVMVLLTELEMSRQVIHSLKQENMALKNEKNNSVKKLEGLISMLEVLDAGQKSLLVEEV